jgi:hypothetical protein
MTGRWGRWNRAARVAMVRRLAAKVCGSDPEWRGTRPRLMGSDRATHPPGTQRKVLAMGGSTLESVYE